ncbi:MAG: hypothetical protein HDR06_16650 [Lachnospiraceae bacterium]|nr:hypothetical protein [Lachnospiraceae bacterium]
MLIGRYRTDSLALVHVFLLKVREVEDWGKICYTIKEWRFDYDRVMEGDKYYAII